MISLGLHEWGRSLELAVEVGRALPDDECVRVLLVLLELDDLLLYSGNVLLPDVYISGIDSGLPAFAFGYPGTCRVGKLSNLIAFAMLAPPLYSLCVVGYGINRLLVFGRIFCVSNVKGVTFES